MLRYFVHPFIFLIVASAAVSGQEDVKIKKSDFRRDKAGFRQAWEHVIAGDAAFIRKGTYYNNAFEHYIQALAYNNSNPELNYKTGITAIYTDRKEEAAGFFLKALESENEVAPDILLYTGRALQYAGRFSEAIDKLNLYLKESTRKNEENTVLAKKFIEECNSAVILLKDTLDVEITNMGQAVNSGSDDFSPVFSFDGKILYFASQRKTEKNATSVPGELPDENIYVSRFIGGAWSAASPAGENIKTEYNESPLLIDSAETKMYIYSGAENGGDIMIAETRKGDWKAPENIPFPINTPASETSIAFSPKGDEIFFVSNNKKDNLGGYDIFFIKKTGERKWSKPQNPGSNINTLYDEQSVSLSLTGDTLWFSSRGHNTMGGFDIFYSVRNSDGSWSEAVNAGFPVNTVWDELFRNSVNSSGSSFCFSSNRNGGFGGQDIYMTKLLKKKPLLSLEE